jgi:putative FmdB family regulatory protein
VLKIKYLEKYFYFFFSLAFANILVDMRFDLRKHVALNFYRGLPMPIYEYNCLKCKNKFEQLRPISKAQENAACPRCNTKSSRAISKFVSRAKDDLSMLNHMPSSGGGSSCGSCSSSNCSSCGSS